MAHACGVDFGTSNSTVGLHRPGQSSLLVLEDGKTTLPSVVFFNAEDDDVSFGRAALTNYLAGFEGRLMRSLKSLLGTPLIDGQTEVMGRTVSFRLLLAQFIGELRRRAQAASGLALDSAVIGRPVFFVDGDPAADRLAEQTLGEIARASGFRHIDFQFEPIAAAFDYETRLQAEELVLVADIGGGTSDFSLVRLSPQRARRTDRRADILANGGVHLGGTDVDKYLSLAAVMPVLGLGSRLQNGAEMPSAPYFNLATWHTINMAYTGKAWSQLQDLMRESSARDQLARLQQLIRQRDGHWLAMQVENGKIALSDTVHVGLSLDRLDPPQQIELTRAGLDTAIAPLLARIESTVAALLTDAGVAPGQVDSIFFTGGSSGVGALRTRIAALMPHARLVEGDLFGSIGTGLALDAARRFG